MTSIFVKRFAHEDWCIQLETLALMVFCSVARSGCFLDFFMFLSCFRSTYERPHADNHILTSSSKIFAVSTEFHRPYRTGFMTWKGIRSGGIGRRISVLSGGF